MAKHRSVLEWMADDTQKPDACGFQPIDPRKWAAVVRELDRRDKRNA